MAVTETPEADDRRVDQQATGGAPQREPPHRRGTAFSDDDHDGWLNPLVANRHVYRPVDMQNCGTTWRWRDRFSNREGIRQPVEILAGGSFDPDPFGAVTEGNPV